jgi:hypothetical protein
MRSPAEPPPRVRADFPIAFRGYDRIVVDEHLAALEEEVLELHASRSPQAAVRRELERVGAETAAILQRAHEAADEVARRSRARADQRIAEAEREAERIRGEAEAHVRRLDRDTDEVWTERRRLLEDARKIAEALLRLADDAIERFPPADDGGAPSPPAPPEPPDFPAPEPPDLGAPQEPDVAAPEPPAPERDLGGLEEVPSPPPKVPPPPPEGDPVESVRRIPRPDAPRHPRRPGAGR